MSDDDENPSRKSSGLAKRIEKLSRTNRGRTWSLILLGIIVIGFSTLFLGQYLGLFAVTQPNIDNPNDYIGYYKVRVFAMNETGDFNQVDANVTVFDYYDDHIISNISADGTTVYRALNVSMAILTWVEDGISYPNSSMLLLCNSTQATATTNDLYIIRNGFISEFESTIYKIDSTFGDLGVGDITNENFTLGIENTNTGNGTFGSQYYIPEPLRANENCTFGALWLKFDTHLNLVLRDDGSEIEVYYDELDNTYVELYSINCFRTETQKFTIKSVGIPTQISIINGQFDGTVLKSF